MHENRLHLVRLFGCAFLFLQGVLCLMWWIKILTDSAVRSAFVWPGVSDAVLYGFIAPDALLYAGSSIVSAIALSGSKTWATFSMGITTGAVLYAELLAVGLSFATGGGWAGAVLMAPSALVTIFISAATLRLETHHAFRR